MAKEKIKDAIKREIIPAVEEAIAEVTEEVMRDTSDLPPGTVIGKGTQRARKVPWTMATIREVYPDITFTPEQTLPVTFNGVSMHLVSGVEVTCPSVFKGLYDDYRASVRRHGSGNVATPYGGVTVLSGAGALPPETGTPPT